MFDRTIEVPRELTVNRPRGLSHAFVSGRVFETFGRSGQNAVFFRVTYNSHDAKHHNLDCDKLNFSHCIIITTSSEYPNFSTVYLNKSSNTAGIAIMLIFIDFSAKL